MLIIDAHLDLAWNALQWNRDLLQPVHNIRVHESRTPDQGLAQSTVALPELRLGRVALSFATMLARSTGNPVPHVDYLSPAQCYGVARGQLAYYRALEQEGHIRVVTTLDELDRHIAKWETWDAALRSNRLASVLRRNGGSWRRRSMPTYFSICERKN